MGFFAPCIYGCFITKKLFSLLLSSWIVIQTLQQKAASRNITWFHDFKPNATSMYPAFSRIWMCVCLICVSVCAVQFDKLRSLLTLYLSAGNKRPNSILICRRDIQFMALTVEAMSNFLRRLWLCRVKWLILLSLRLLFFSVAIIWRI